MLLFEPSTTLECAVTDSVPPCCDVQVNESITTSFMVGSVLMVTVAVEESVRLAFKEILSEKVTLVAAGAAGAAKEGVEVSAPARVTVGQQFESRRR